MLTITFALLICQHLSTSWSTRLPLEVYELAPLSAPTAAVAAAAAADGISTTHHHELNYLQHKSLEYSTVNAKTLTAEMHAATAAAIVNVGGDVVVAAADDDDDQQKQQQQPTDMATVLTTDAKTNSQQQLDRRRSRQMLEIIQQQQQQQLQQQHRFNHDALHLQKLQQQPQQQPQEQFSHNKDNKHGGGGHAKDVRILYQIGESEADLPICAPNAVCSKIDLYETPWIERQCRCPDTNHMTNVIIHHHHTSNNNNNNNNNKDVSNIHDAAAAQQHNLRVSEKYRSYFEKEKLLQHKRLLVSGDFGDSKKFESLHLKKLMQKLGAVYEEDLHLQPSDYLIAGGGGHEDNDAVPFSLEELDEIADNEFPHGPPRRLSTSSSSSSSSSSAYATNTAHMRHSGHMGHKAKETFLGGCPSGLGIEDGHTIADKTRHYKMCQPVHKLPVCKHFRDYTWTLTTASELNVTEQIVHCRCPKNSVTYLTKREPAADGLSGYTYLFACSPLTRIRCQRKEPCKLFTVRKRQEFLDEVNINALCQCPKGHHCPSHHTQSGVIAGESFLEDNIQTYSGYCMTND